LQGFFFAASGAAVTLAVWRTRRHVLEFTDWMRTAIDVRLRAIVDDAA